MGATRWASPLDAIFLIGETPETLMHVGSLLHFTYPPDADEDYLHDLVAALRGAPVEPPWNLRLQTRRVMRQPNCRPRESPPVIYRQARVSAWYERAAT